MAKPSVLDEAIGCVPVRANPTGLRLDRVLAQLTDCDDFDRLLDMLTAPPDQWGHRQMAGIIRHLCEHYGADHEKLVGNDVSAWRRQQAER